MTGVQTCALPISTDWLGTDVAALSEAAARAHVTRRYLAAFGPASIDDIAAYVGRGKGGIGVWRTAVADLGDEVINLEADDGRVLLDLADAPRPRASVSAPPRLLARWDSALLSHAPKFRQRIIADEHRPAVFTKNADVLPTFLLDGFVAGTWQLERQDGGAAIELRPFAPLTPKVADALGAEAERVLSLLAPDAEGRSARIAT